MTWSEVKTEIARKLELGTSSYFKVKYKEANEYVTIVDGTNQKQKNSKLISRTRLEQIFCCCCG
jgi:hypothetical protein